MHFIHSPFCLFTTSSIGLIFYIRMFFSALCNNLNFIFSIALHFCSLCFSHTFYFLLRSASIFLSCPDARSCPGLNGNDVGMLCFSPCACLSMCLLNGKSYLMAQVIWLQGLKANEDTAWWLWSLDQLCVGWFAGGSMMTLTKCTTLHPQTLYDTYM